jgi:hypothetical protein
MTNRLRPRPDIRRRSLPGQDRGLAAIPGHRPQHRHEPAQARRLRERRPRHGVPVPAPGPDPRAPGRLTGTDQERRCLHDNFADDPALTRGLWQPSGWPGSYAGRGGSSAANWTHSGSSTHDGTAGTGSPVITKRRQLHDHGACACNGFMTRRNPGQPCLSAQALSHFPHGCIFGRIARYLPGSAGTAPGGRCG